ncbi:uncharacterized protein PHALS_10456 [Plasmopara halstedii]|uniref:Uncharacterized protein n=1 Tax=Plasmopara halstedii TaxID=4781 RepID=A0A0P1AGE5_PLAHL|nr:uncharacterized protein PHALS_10456 [Plasmopara halstedii]CEG40244.1 hypothetical protein PHALS_10456 [Plasmopara halstedii]|eukprot:XP_024576613.1 hypothetical protein PHALS_10456 [Plasmopara halstedii]
MNAYTKANDVRNGGKRELPLDFYVDGDEARTCSREEARVLTPTESSIFVIYRLADHNARLYDQH